MQRFWSLLLLAAFLGGQSPAFPCTAGTAGAAAADVAHAHAHSSSPGPATHHAHAQATGAEPDVPAEQSQPTCDVVMACGASAVLAPTDDTPPAHWLTWQRSALQALSPPSAPHTSDPPPPRS